jgi:hypothetical protein
MEHLGLNSILEIAKETTFGTVVTGKLRLNIESDSVSQDNKKENDSSILVTDCVSGATLKEQSTKGDITIKEALTSDLPSLGLLLDEASIPTSSGGKYLHTLNPFAVASGTVLPTFTLTKQLGDTGVVNTFAGLQLSNAEIGMDWSNMNVDLKYTVVGKGTVVSGTLSGSTNPNGNKLLILNSIALLNNVNISDSITKATISYNAGLNEPKGVWASGYNKPKRAHGLKEVKVTLEVLFDGTFDTFKKTFVPADAYAPVDLKLLTTSGEYLRFYMPNVSFTADDPGTTKDILLLTLTGTAVRLNNVTPLTVYTYDSVSTKYLTAL